MEIDTLNKFVVGAYGDQIVVMKPPLVAMTRVEALTFAAWLVALADDGSEPSFEEIRKAVEST